VSGATQPFSGAGGKGTRRSALVFAVIAGLTLLADFATKRLAFSRLQPGEAYQIIPWLLALRLSHNLGAVWGIGQGKGAFFALFTLVAAAGICWAAGRYGGGTRLLNAGLGLLLGGALGNLWDRLNRIFGEGQGVRDFIDAYVGPHHWPTFNVADSAICVGAALIMLHAFREPAVKPDAPS